MIRVLGKAFKEPLGGLPGNASNLGRSNCQETLPWRCPHHPCLRFWSPPRCGWERMVRGLFWVTGCYTEPNEKDQTSANLSDKSTTRIRDGPGTNRIEKCIPHQQITGISQVNIVRGCRRWHLSLGYVHWPLWPHPVLVGHVACGLIVEEVWAAQQL
jgi:hypothetical protein